MSGKISVGKSGNQPILLNDSFGSNKKLYLNSKLEKDKEELRKNFSFKSNNSGKGITIERTTVSAQPMTEKSGTSRTQRKSSWSSPDDELVRIGKGYREYRKKDGRIYHEPIVEEKSEDEIKKDLEAWSRVLTPYWNKFEAELKNVTDEEARQEYEANRKIYDTKDDSGLPEPAPLEQARRAVAARRVLNRQKKA